MQEKLSFDELPSKPILKKKSKQIEDEFDIIEDGVDQSALISYYNDSEFIEEVPLKDMLFQGITNLGFMFKTNGSKQVNLAKDLQSQNQSNA